MSGNINDPAIASLYQAWSAAFRKGDVEAIIGLLTTDYILWAAGTPPLTVDTLRPRLTAAFAAYEISSVFECEERLISGDMALDRGWDVQQVRPRAGGDAVSHRQRVFLLLRRCPDSIWRFARGMSQPGPAQA